MPSNEKLLKRLEETAGSLNPRWVICEYNLGRSFACWEFNLWIDARIREFKNNPERIAEEKAAGDAAPSCSMTWVHFYDNKLCTAGQEAFDKWLIKHSGKAEWKDV